MDVDAESAAQADEALVLLERIKPMFAGRAPAVTSAVLADLFSCLLAGHQDEDGEGERIEEIRNNIILRWVKLVKDLIPINVAQIREQYGLDEKRH